MLHQPTPSAAPKLQQVEMNMIAASFSNLGSRVVDMHHYMINRHAALRSAYETKRLVINDAIERLPESLVEAFHAYGAPNAIIVMIIQPGEKNAFDQRMLEYGCAMLGVRMKRYSLKQIHDLAQLDAASGKLTIDGDEIALAYFRAGYTPNDYPTNDEWRARVKLETSMAIKCPTLAQQLAGLKKVAQSGDGNVCL